MRCCSIINSLYDMGLLRKRQKEIIFKGWTFRRSPFKLQQVWYCDFSRASGKSSKNSMQLYPSWNRARHPKKQLYTSWIEQDIPKSNCTRHEISSRPGTYTFPDYTHTCVYMCLKKFGKEVNDMDEKFSEKIMLLIVATEISWNRYIKAVKAIFEK